MVEIKTLEVGKIKVNNKIVTIDCNTIVNEYDLDPTELSAVLNYIDNSRSRQIQSSVVSG